MNPPARIKTFAYVTSEKAALYRAVMRVFMESKERFALYLRPLEVLDLVRAGGLRQADQAEIESALAQLSEWGNLQSHPDTSAVSTVEDFYKQRYLFQITNQGEAAERALQLFQAASHSEGELQSNALADIRDLLRELKEFSKEAEPDSAKVHRTCIMISTRLEDLTSRSHAFMSSLQRRIDLQAGQDDEFASDTQRLVDYIERFLAELVIGAEDIAENIRAIEESGIGKLLHAAAERSIVGVAQPTPEAFNAAVAEWRSHWESLRRWFVSRPGRPSTADILRGQARAAIRGMLGVIANINDRLISRIDRSNDFRVLARWFAQAESDAAAHRLWRAAFGLCPARHLSVNDATLDEHEAQESPADTSWLSAPPLKLSPRLRSSGTYSRTARLSRIIDRTAEKEKLAAATNDEAKRILSAQSRFAISGRLRLSELEQLDAGEFDFFLDLLGEAVSGRGLTGDTVEILSNDGSLTVRLQPTDDARLAVIQTPEGIFSGPDHWITIERSSAREVVT